MPILLCDSETRATTNRVMAAIERFVGWMLFGPRQHDSDLRWSLGTCQPERRRETTGEESAQC